MAEIGRNELCPCGSGKKYKYCCMGKDESSRKQGMMRDIFDGIREEMANKSFDSINKANAFLQLFMKRKNRKPVEEFFGINPEQMHRMLNRPYDGTSDIVDFNVGLPPNEFQPIPAVKRVLVFLNALSGWEPVKATKKGNLSLGFSRELAERIYANERFPWFRKIMSEEDMIEVLSLRHILTMCGWIKKRKGAFSLTKNGRAIIDGGFEGKHYFRLLKIFTTKFNWAFQDRYPEFYIIQQSFLFSLYLLKKKAIDYVEGRTIANCLIDAYPQVLAEVNKAYKPPYEIVGDCIELRTLKRLGVYFGFLLEKSEKRKDIYRDQLFVKTTDFFRRFISWHVA